MQFYINGNAIKIECSQKMNEILTQVRQVLSNNVKLTPLCRTWLLLAIDVAHNRFGLLPAELQRFYQEQLGDKAMANFQVKFLRIGLCGNCLGIMSLKG